MTEHSDFDLIRMGLSEAPPHDHDHLAYDALDRVERALEGEREIKIALRDEFDAVWAKLRTELQTAQRAVDKAVFQLRSSEDEYARLVGERLSAAMVNYECKKSSQAMPSGVRCTCEWPSSSCALDPAPDPEKCIECGYNLYAYPGPRCRYCDGTAE